MKISVTMTKNWVIHLTDLQHLVIQLDVIGLSSRDVASPSSNTHSGNEYVNKLSSSV